MNLFFRTRTVLMTLIPTIALMILGNLLDFSISPRHVQVVSGGILIPDTNLGFYSAKDAYGMIDAMGAPGRQAYPVFSFGFDIIFPLLYTTALFSLLGTLIRRIGARRLSALLVLPLLAGLSDLLENVCINIMIFAFPMHNAIAETVVGSFTGLKWGGTIVTLVLCGVLGIVAAFQQKTKK